MTVQITIEVPDSLSKQLRRFQDRLPEALERGIRELELVSTEPEEYQDESKILELLVSQPSPEQVLGIRPSPQLQARVSELLIRSKTNTLSRQEEAELERYLTLEHLVRLAKAHAFKKIDKKQ